MEGKGGFNPLCKVFTKKFLEKFLGKNWNYFSPYRKGVYLLEKNIL